MLKSNTIAPVDDHSIEIPAPPLLVWLILLAMLALTALVWNQARKDVDTSAQIAFRQHVERTTRAVQDRMYKYDTILRGGIGLFKSSDHVSRKEWQTYVAGMELSERAPGMQGMGFAKHIQPADLGRHIHQIRAEGFAGYNVTPPGPRPEYTSIIYIEPFDTRNKRAFGFDMYTEPTRYKAMARARDTGEAAISGLVKLKQETDTDIQSGFLMYLPLYKNNAKLDSAEQRAQALLGYVYAAFRMNDLMAGILGNEENLPAIDLEIYDGETVSSATLMYDSDNIMLGKIMHGKNENKRKLFNVVQPILIAGHVWTLSISSTPLFEARIERAKLMIIGLSGIIISFLFFTIAWSLATRSARAQQLADRMTSEVSRQVALNHAIGEEIRQLNTELNQFKNTLDQTLECIFMFDPESLRFIYINEGAKRQIGYSETELLQMTPVDIKPLFTLAQFQQVLQPLIAGVLPSLTFQTVHRHKDGHDIPVEIFLQLVHLEGQSQPPRFVAMVNDISARKESETRLLNAMNEAKAANAAKSEFLSNISHEIRTPMNSIIGMTKLALKTHLDAKQHDYLIKIDYSAQHLLALINEILDIAKMEAHKLVLEMQVFKLDMVINNISSQLSQSAASKGLRLKFDVDHSLSVPLAGDPLRLTQILLNYTNNAIKFTSKGEIVIRARVIEEGADDLLIRFEVQDSGIGISAAQIEKLFQAYHQADASVTREYGGTGLGLAICKQLVELMGGEVGVESQPGQGSTFWFTARLAKGGELLTVTQPAAPNLDVLKDASILLVEDNLFNQQISVEILREVGALVSIANNGQEAIDMLLKRRYDCVLMDVQMPVMDGIEATRRIRANPLLAGNHIIAMTANAGKEDKARCLATGMDDFITKPIFADQLYAAIAQFIPISHASSNAPKEELKMGNELIPDVHAAGSHSIEDTSTTAQPALIDLSVLAKIIGSDPAKIKIFSHKFLLSAQQGLSEIEDALKRENMPELAALGHRNKSPARTVGALAYAELCLALEQFKGGGDIAQARQIVEQMRLLLAKIAEKINAEVV